MKGNHPITQKALFIGLTVVELVVIVFLVFFIINKRRLTVFTNMVSPQYYAASSSSSLASYREFLPGIRRDNFAWLKKPVRYLINTDTLNAATNYSIQKAPNVFRVMVIGDSFTYGLYVNTEDAWPNRLGEFINSDQACNKKRVFEVINLGFPGNDFQLTVERFNLRGKKYAPDLVVFLYLDNDFTELKEYLFPLLNKEKERLQLTGEYDEMRKQGVPIPQYHIYVQLVQRLQKEYGEQRLLKIQKSFLNRLITIYRGPLIFTTFPSTPIKYRNIIQELVQKRKRTYHRLLAVDIRQTPSLSFLPYDGHPNKKGHAAIAYDIFTYLKRSRLIPCD